MPTRIMLVHLNRRIRGDDEHRRLTDTLPLAFVRATPGSPNDALGVKVEADTRAEAERVAHQLVAGVLGPDEIVHVTGDDDVMQDRQLMFWLLATRQQLRAWEVSVAESVRLGLLNRDRDGPLVWSAHLARHMALVAGGNLLRALRNAEDRYTAMPEQMESEVEVLRNLHEHWDEQWPLFYDVRHPGPLERSGRPFAKLHPGKSPYSALEWDSNDGPRVSPGLLASDLHRYLDALQVEVLTAEPELARFAMPIEPSPWMGPPAGRDQWWPHARA